MKLPEAFLWSCRRWNVSLTRFALVVKISRQQVGLFERNRQHACSTGSSYEFKRRYLASTSRIGIGQQAGSNRTPLGLHRVAAKIGGGCPIGTVFENRKPVGLTWQGKPDAPIAHRILWLEGLELGFNRGGQVDSKQRYIYIHGVGDETTLGRPASRGCVHLAATDLIPLFDRLLNGTLVWICE